MIKQEFILIEKQELQTVIIDCMNSCLKHNKQEVRAIEQSNQWLNLDDLIEYDPEKRTKPTWYSKISKGEIPYHKKGKKVYFLKSEIDEWLKGGKRKTITEIEAESEIFLSKNKK
ncbi:helix-turn-helix domain-containing protein [Maribacter sp. CXY002]|uniref:helix-turn-helix domain-containing protein n=1 Tax=Maribacter luteocoastalis TaxID=3407671 RepID=UPI003B66F597